MEWYHYVIALVGSALAGAINTLAGNGSAITLTIMTELLGLPGNMANGTNRIGVFTQSAAGSWAFYKKGRLNLTSSGLFTAPMVVGAIIGVLVAVWVSNEQFKFVFKILMVVMLFAVLVNPKRWVRETDPDAKPNPWISIPLFLALGFYGGFIQMGMGIFFLAVMVLGARFSLIDSNAVKAFVIAIYTAIVIAIFQWKGLIDWPIGLLFAAGQTVGGYFTARHAANHPKANIWAHRLLVLIVVLAILQLFGLPKLLGIAK